MNNREKRPQWRGCPDIAAPALKTPCHGVGVGATLMRTRAMYAKALSVKQSLWRAALAAVALVPFVANDVRAQAPDVPPAQTEPAPNVEPATGVVIT
jgi:hypothetical protein